MGRPIQPCSVACVDPGAPFFGTCDAWPKLGVLGGHDGQLKSLRLPYESRRAEYARAACSRASWPISTRRGRSGSDRCAISASAARRGSASVGGASGSEAGQGMYAVTNTASRSSSYSAFGVANCMLDPAQSVANPPSWAIVTRIPKGATSADKASLNPSSAHLPAF